VENLNKHHIDCLVCLGGGGTQKNALRLHQVGGINVITLPKTIDNDVFGTDCTFGYDTAVQIATEAIDRLHTTATSHHRAIVCEIMGHRTGWLTLSAGIAGGADVILIPEIPYDINIVAEYLQERRRRGSRFSIIAVAEGAVSVDEIPTNEEKKAARKKKKSTASKEQKNDSDESDTESHIIQESIASRTARRLQQMTGIDARVTCLGHIQRGGIPSSFDRLLCTRMGTKVTQLLSKGVYNVMVGYDSGHCQPIPLEEVAGRRKTVPADHPMITTARLVGTCLGDKPAIGFEPV
jgi:6-phosphofructokinase 1